MAGETIDGNFYLNYNKLIWLYNSLTMERYNLQIKQMGEPCNVEKYDRFRQKRNRKRTSEDYG